MDVIEHFKALCAIPHCSGQTEAVKAYLCEKAEQFGYIVSTDAADNLLCAHPESVLTLQAHYDMVCIGNAPHFQLVEEAGWLRAEASTLGADNGMGVAIMLTLMQEGAAIDALFTAEEETGLDGARGLALPLKTDRLLNLDSEAFGEITIGCAGGVDLNVSLPLTIETQERYGYKVVSQGYAGGHSGVDIDKNIPNAIKELAAKLYGHDLDLVTIKGGERRNAIAKRAQAMVASKTPIEAEGFSALGRKPYPIIENDIVGILHGFAHGVRGFNVQLGIVQTSINLAMLEVRDDALQIKLSARSMNNEELLRLQSETEGYFKAFKASVRSEGFYAPWEPETNTFVTAVQAAYKTITPEVSIGAIHAGLECGIIKQKYPGIQMASIGPTILYPHSTRECVDLSSVEAIYRLVWRIVSAP